MHVGLSSWIVQDGNYGDFESGKSYRFALEFYPHEFARCQAGSPLLRHTAGGMHEARGNIVRATKSHWVVDFGVPAFQNSKPPRWVKAGRSVQGTVYIGVDPFFYFEVLKDEPGMPDLFRTWQVRRILLETTPWRETTDASGRRVIARAEVPPTFIEVPRTDAWKDDDGRAAYVLECEPEPAGKAADDPEPREAG